LVLLFEKLRGQQLPFCSATLIQNTTSKHIHHHDSLGTLKITPVLAGLKGRL